MGNLARNRKLEKGNSMDYSNSGLCKSPPVSKIDGEIANNMLFCWHYLGRVRGIICAYGHEEGCLVFTNLRSRVMEGKLRSEEIIPIELARMVGKPDHLWSMSSLMSKAIGILKSRREYDVIVTYADPLAGHDGMVYRAANWTQAGWSVKDGHPVFIIDGRSVSPRTLYSRIGTSSIQAVKEYYGDRVKIVKKDRKGRFVYPLTNKGKRIMEIIT